MPTMYFLSRNKKNVTIFHHEIVIFTAVKLVLTNAVVLYM